MDMTFRETDRQKEQIEIAVESMLYICKGCDQSFSLPLLPEKEKRAFLFPTGERAYYFLSFTEMVEFYDQMQVKLKLYTYPYIKFEGFDQNGFLSYVEQRLWADLIDRGKNEAVNSPLSEQRCPHCNSKKLKVIGRLLHCQGEEANFQILQGTLDGFLALSSEEQNRLIIMLIKEYAIDYRSMMD